MIRFIFVGICAIILFSCRKKELIDIKTADQYVSIVEHCYNNKRDLDELGEDCGGDDCDPCVQTYSPCEYTYDGYYFGDGGGASEVFTLKTISESEGSYTFIGKAVDGSYISVKFDHFPSLTTFYKGSNYSDEDVVNLKYRSVSGNNWVGSGRVYVNYVENVYAISGCNNSFKLWNGSTILISFKMTFN